MHLRSGLRFCWTCLVLCVSRGNGRCENNCETVGVVCLRRWLMMLEVDRHAYRPTGPVNRCAGLAYLILMVTRRYPTTYIKMADVLRVRLANNV